MKAWYQKHQAEVSVRHALWYVDNAPADKERSASWKATHPDQKRAYDKAYAQKHRDRRLRSAKKNSRRYVNNMSDNYLRQLLVEGTAMRHADIPADVVALKREQLTLRRLARQLMKEINESSSDTR